MSLSPSSSTARTISSKEMPRPDFKRSFLTGSHRKGFTHEVYQSVCLLSSLASKRLVTSGELLRCPPSPGTQPSARLYNKRGGPARIFPLRPAARRGEPRAARGARARERLGLDARSD